MRKLIYTFLMCTMMLSIIGCGSDIVIHTEGQGIQNQKNDDDKPTLEDLGHTADHTVVEYPADYIECKGGFKEPYLVCEECCLAFNSEGEMDIWEEGTGVHIPSEDIYPANYIECMGGIAEDYYICVNCDEIVDADGNLIPWTEGNGPHEVDKELGLMEADYTECNGGTTIDYYLCKNCYISIDENGNNIFEYYKEGSGQHSVTNVNTLPYMAVALTCSDGNPEITPLYECDTCKQLVTEEGQMIYWGEGNLGGHEPDYDVTMTAEQYNAENPGQYVYYESVYLCKHCGWPISIDGFIAMVDFVE